jgi:hypothetical protein
MIKILNTSILTCYGSYSYEPLTLEESKLLISEGFESAVGHQSTCDILSSLLGKEVKLNRIQYSQKEGEIALVFKLKGRPEEGKILSVSEIEQIGYEFGKLTRLQENKKENEDDLFKKALTEIKFNCKNEDKVYHLKGIIKTFNILKSIQMSESFFDLTTEEKNNFYNLDQAYSFWH